MTSEAERDLSHPSIISELAIIRMQVERTHDAVTERKESYCPPESLDPINLPYMRFIDILDGQRICVTDREKKAALLFNWKGEFVAEVGKGVLKSPYATRFDHTGRHLWIADHEDAKIYAFDYSSAGYECVREWSVPEGPMGLAFAEGLIFYTAYSSNSLIALDYSGKEVWRYSPANVGACLNGPCGIAFCFPSLIVTNWDSSCISRFDLSGETGEPEFKGHFRIGDAAKASEPELNHPWDVTVAVIKGYKRVFVTDSDNHRVCEFTVDLKSYLGSYGKRKGESLFRPAGIAVNDEHCFVVDKGNDRVLKLPLTLVHN